MQFKNRLVILCAVGVAFSAFAQACATQVTSDIEEVADTGADTATTTPIKDASPANVKDAGKDTAPVTVKDSGPIDSGSPDAAVNSPGEQFDPTAPKEGQACPAGTLENASITRRCGYCGTQVAFCQGAKVSAYGPCNSEHTEATRCLPNASRTAACGICGTEVDNCDPGTCKWDPGSCDNELANGCNAGEITYIRGACANPDDVRKQVCGSMCTLLPADPCGPEPLDTLTIPTDGTVATGLFKFSASGLTSKRPNVGACPASSLASPNGGPTPFHFVLLKNTTAAPVKIDAWPSTAPGGVSYDTISTAYARASRPTMDADILACTGKTVDTCSGSPCTGFSWSGLVGTDGLTVPANGSVLVMTSGYSGVTSAGKPLQFNVQVQPPPPPAGTATVEAPLKGTTSTYLYTLTNDSARRGGSCPNATLSTPSISTYFTVTNTTATPKLVSVWEGAKTSFSDAIDTVMASYATMPASDTDRKACVAGVSDTCNVNPCESDSGLVVGDKGAVSVPANGSAVIYVGAYFSDETPGSKVVIKLRTE